MTEPPEQKRAEPARLTSTDRTFGGLRLALIVVPFGLVLRDLVRVMSTAPWRLSFVDALVLLAIGASLGVLTLSALLLPRHALARAVTSRGPSGQALVGAIDAVGLGMICILLQNPSFIVGDLRFYTTVGAIVLLTALRFGWMRMQARRRVITGHVVAALCVIGGVALLAFLLRWNGDWWFKLAPHALLVIGLSHFANHFGFNISARAFGITIAAALLLLISTSLVTLPKPALNALLHGTIHARVWTRILQKVSDQDADLADNVLGGHDCDPRRSSVFPGASERPGNGLDDNCVGGDSTTPRLPPLTSKSLHGVAKGSDVLLLSLDSLRWDAHPHLAKLSAELGPHVRFERAVSPAPGTRESLSATLRGRSLRQLKIENAPQSTGAILWRDPSPTLGHALVKAGYRVITVPTSNVADPRIGIASGFENIWVANYDARHEGATRSPFTQRYVPAEQVLPIALDAARDTPHALCVWLHLMETHSPFHLQGAADKSPLRGAPRFHQAIDETARRLVSFVREWKAIRGRAPIIAVFGDHGEEFGEHGGSHHASTVYAEQSRVTWLLAGPGLKETRVDAPTTIASLPATILDLIGAPIPNSMTEPSLLPSLQNEQPWPTLAVTELRSDVERVYAYTGARYRYVWDPAHGFEQLFDMTTDPTDQNDIAATDPAALNLMRDLARAWDETH